MELSNKDRDKLAAIINRNGPLATLACIRDQYEARMAQLQLPNQQIDQAEAAEVHTWVKLAVDMLLLNESTLDKARIMERLKSLAEERTEEAETKLDGMIERWMMSHIMQPGSHDKIQRIVTDTRMPEKDPNGDHEGYYGGTG
jgi:hypothetical protein